MKLSELINKLQGLHRDYGDIEVRIEVDAYDKFRQFHIEKVGWYDDGKTNEGIVLLKNFTE